MKTSLRFARCHLPALILEIPRLLGRLLPASRRATGLILMGGAAWLATAPVSLALSPSLVLAEIYGGGGNAGATYLNDYIVLFNRGGSSVNVSNWSVQYASAAGTSWQVSTLPDVSIPAGGYYLIQEASGGANGAALPTPDLVVSSGAINLAGGAGKVALVTNNTALSGACPSGPHIVDFVGYGPGANCSESANAPAPDNMTAAQRKNGGCSETDTNANDFVAVAPNPRNSATPTNSCTTSPTGSGLATPNSLIAGDTTLLTITVTPGINPASTSLVVTGNLSSIGGLAEQPFYDDGTHGDVSSNDHIFTFEATVDGATTTGAKTLPAIITDAQSRTGVVSISVTVNPAAALPEITQQPASQTVWAGGSAAFTVTASGTPPLFFQWRFNETILTDQTNSSLLLSNLVQSGNIDVVVTNQVGAITSSVAVLTIRAPIATNIAGLRQLVDAVNFLPTDTTNLYQVEGVVTSHTNLTTSGNALFYIQDASAGIAVFVSGSTTVRPRAGDLVRVVGPLGHFNGLLELNLVAANPTHSVTTNSSNNPTPEPAPFLFSTATNVALMETNFEGRLVVVSNVFLEAGSPTFPNPGNVTLTNASGETFILRIDNRVTDIAGQPRPLLAEAIIGVIAQSDTSDPRSSGYQILPSRRADIIDGRPPEITTPPLAQSAECTTGSATFTVTATGAGALRYQWRFNNGDILNATNATLTISPTLPATAGGYSVVISNLVGSVTSVVATLTLVDTVPPGLTCPAPLTVQCDAQVPAPNFAGGSVTDACDPAPVVAHLGDVTNGICPRTITRSYRAMDAGSNVTTCTQLITLLDTTPPAISCGQSTFLELGQPWDFANPVVTDNCGGPTSVVILSTVTNRTCGNTFVATRVWQATDLCENTNFCTQVVIVVDFTPPTLACPTNLTVACEADIPAPNFGGGIVTDLGDPHPLVIHVADVTNGFCPKVITRTYRAADACENTNSCSQTITVHDTSPPVAGCAPDLTVDCEANWTFTPPSPVDQCDGTNVSVAVVSTATNKFCGMTYSATRMWVVSDACGNFTNCSQTITVVDITPPLLVCPTNLAVECGTAWSFGVATATDQCDATNVVVAIVETVTNHLGGASYTATRTWTATDVCSNVSICSQTVTVRDTTPPNLACPADVLIQCAGTNGATTTFAVAGTDNCDPLAVFQCEPPSGSLFPPGTTLVTCRGYDDAGNTNTCTFTVTVDATLPSLSIQRQGTNAVICWPAACANYTLEQTTALSSPGSWMPVATPPVAAANDQWCVTLPIANGNRFFRLQRN